MEDDVGVGNHNTFYTCKTLSKNGQFTISDDSKFLILWFSTTWAIYFKRFMGDNLIPFSHSHPINLSQSCQRTVQSSGFSQQIEKKTEKDT